MPKKYSAPNSITTIRYHDFDNVEETIIDPANIPGWDQIYDRVTRYCRIQIFIVTYPLCHKPSVAQDLWSPSGPDEKNGMTSFYSSKGERKSGKHRSRQIFFLSSARAPIIPCVTRLFAAIKRIGVNLVHYQVFHDPKHHSLPHVRPKIRRFDGLSPPNPSIDNMPRVP